MIIVILNEGAGRGGDQTAEIRSAFEAVGADATILVAKSKSIDSTVQEAIRRGATTIVAAGGDGTVNAVASAIAGTPVHLGILPLGTLNHFAKDAGIPLGLVEAVATIVADETKAVDAASVNGCVFINNSSIGLYPLMVRDREKQRFKFKRSKWWAMLLASAATFKRFPIMNVKITIDGITKPYSTPAVFVGNNSYQLEAFSVRKRNSLDSGQISVIAVKTLSSWRTLLLVMRVAFLGHTEGEVFEIACTDEMVLDLKRKAIDVSLDGEVVKLAPPLRYMSMKHSLLVILPRPK